MYLKSNTYFYQDSTIEDYTCNDEQNSNPVHVFISCLLDIMIMHIAIKKSELV